MNDYEFCSEALRTIAGAKSSNCTEKLKALELLIKLLNTDETPDNGGFEGFKWIKEEL